MKTKLKSLPVLALLSLLFLPPSLRADSFSTEAIINVPLDAAWELFTTEDGLKSLGYRQASTNLHLQGTWQASGGDTPLGDFKAAILSLDPQHMLSFQLAEQANDQWTVLYFTAMGGTMTQLRWLEFFPEPQRVAVTQRQQRVRKQFDLLIRRFAPECHVCKLERERAEAGGH